MRARISSDEARKIAFGFSPPDHPHVATRWRDGLGANHSLLLPFGEAPALRIYERFTEAGFDDLFQQRLLV